MKRLYNSVNETLNNVNFEALWEDFERIPFAIYNKKEVILSKKTISWDKRFIGNTLIDYEGSPLVIWGIENIKIQDADYLAANLIHEMAHYLQRKKGEKRYPDELMLLNYPANTENFKIKFIENKLIVMAFYESDPLRRRNMLKRFMEMRKNRETIIGDYAEEEFLAETIEGIAEHIALKALNQISRYKYELLLNRYAVKLQTLDEGLFDIRRMGYYTGVFLLEALDNAGINFRNGMGMTRESIFSSVSRGIKPETVNEPRYNDRLNEIYLKFNENKAFKINIFMAEHKKLTKGNYKIIQFDPMNMIKCGNKILNTNFLKLYNVDNGLTVEFYNPVLIEIKPEAPYEVVSYTV